MSKSTSIDIKVPSLLPTLLLVLFIGLKLTGHITWSWWWVMSPLWIPIAFVLLILLGFGTLYAAVRVLESFPNRRLR